MPSSKVSCASSTGQGSGTEVVCKQRDIELCGSGETSALWKKIVRSLGPSATSQTSRNAWLSSLCQFCGLQLLRRKYPHTVFTLTHFTS